MVLAIAAATAFAVFLAAVAIGPQVWDLAWRQLHHAYLGAALVIAGLAALRLRPQARPWVRRCAWALAIAGAVLIADDALQHGVQRWGGDPAYRSPLHRAYGVLYRALHSRSS